MVKSSYSVGLVYADGVPFDTATGLSAAQALREYEALCAKYTRVPPLVLVYDADDPERHVDADVLAEEAESWPEYEQGIEDDKYGPDFTSADFHDADDDPT